MTLHLTIDEARALLTVVESYADAFEDDPDSDHEVATAQQVAARIREALR